jgi:hypothetical protein
VLALLQVSGRAPKADQKVIDQIKNISGEYRFESYILTLKLGVLFNSVFSTEILDDMEASSSTRASMSLEVSSSPALTLRTMSFSIGEVCPAKWEEGGETLTPSLDLVGKI